jgi:hypothetical protein
MKTGKKLYRVSQNLKRMAQQEKAAHQKAGSLPPISARNARRLSRKRHEHGIAKAELLMAYSGYSEASHGYVYTYREECECGAHRTVRYKDAASAEAAHKHLKGEG